MVNYSLAYQNLIVAILIQLLGLYVYFKNPKMRLNRSFEFFCAMFSLWMVGFYYLYLSKTITEAIFWSKVIYVGVCFASVSAHHFVREFLNIKNKVWILWIFYSLSLAFLCLALFHNELIRGVYLYPWGYYPRAGAYHPIFMGYIFVETGYSLVLLYKKYKGYNPELSQLEHERVRLVYYAFALGHIVLINFLPTYGIDIYPLAHLYMVILFVVISYAIVRHQLMDIEVIIRKTLVFTGLLVSVFAILILPTLIIQDYILRSASTAAKMMGLSVSGIFIILTMRRIETFLINVTDKYLFQKKYDSKELLNAFTTEVLTVLEMDKLVKLTSSKLTDIARIKASSVVLFENASDELKGTSAYIQRQDVIDRQINMPRPLEELMESTDSEIMIPVLLHDKAVGLLLLGKKKSDEGYSKDDFDILVPLARTLAIAISNASFVEEIKKTQKLIAQKDKMATIGTLAAGMAHEIRNPITTIRTFADYLPERFGDREFIDAFRKLIPNEIVRVENIARLLLEFAYSESRGKAEEFDILIIIKDILTLLEPQYKLLGIQISLDTSARAIIMANKDQARDALFNIVKYVVSESPNNSTVSVRTERNGSRLSVLIKDEKLAVPGQVVKDVFEPSSVSGGAKRGFGFDLFIAKELIEKNGGKFSIIQGGTKGAEFRVEFSNASGPL